MAKKKNWIAAAVGQNPGALHAQLGVPAGEKIPAKTLKKAAKSKNPTTQKRVQLAQTLASFNKKK